MIACDGFSSSLTASRLFTPVAPHDGWPSPARSMTICPCALMMRDAQLSFPTSIGSLYVGFVGSITFALHVTRAASKQLTLIHQSPLHGLNDVSVSSPPSTVDDSVIVRIVPARKSDQIAAAEKVISPCDTAPFPYHTSVPSASVAPVSIH